MKEVFEGKYITVEFFENSKSGKTKIYYVFGQNGAKLGEIKWFGAWRRYSFYPEDKTLFEKTCLLDIIKFIDEITLERKSKYA